MGAAGSAIGSKLAGKVIKKELLDEEILSFLSSNIKNLPDEIHVQNVFKAIKDKTDVFLTHNWGPNQDNHKLVAKINQGLKDRGIITWFDSEKMEGNVKKKMTEGIDNASCVAVFITELYIDKVKGDNAEDNCQLEFGYSARSKTSKGMIPVVMEPGVRNANAWKGEVGMVLGGNLYLDMCEVTDQKIDELVERIVATNNGVKLKDLFEKCINLVMSSAHAAPGTAAAAGGAAAAHAAPAAPAVDYTSNEVYQWLVGTVKLTVKSAHACTHAFHENNIGSVDRLLRRYSNEEGLLESLKIDAYDIEDISNVLNKQLGGGEGEAEGEEEAAPQMSEKDFARKKFKLVQTAAHEHVMTFISVDGGAYAGGWGCDGRNTESGCYKGCTDAGDTRGWNRYTCKPCNFDFCDGCSAAHFTSGLRDGDELNLPEVHEHPLYLKREDNGWACDARKFPDGCQRGCTDFYQSNGWDRWNCEDCGFDLCDCCAAWYGTGAV